MSTRLRVVFALILSMLCSLPVLGARLTIEPVFNRVEGSGPGPLSFPFYNPDFLINGVAYFVADEPGEIVSYASGDPRDPGLDIINFYNNTNYNITGITLRLVGTAPVTDDPGTIVRGPVDAVFGDVNGDGKVGLSDYFATITVSPDGKEIRFENGVIPVGGRFTDIHLAFADDPPFFAAIDSSFSGDAVPEPATVGVGGIALLSMLLIRRNRLRA
jgi:hypothetical protein